MRYLLTVLIFLTVVFTSCAGEASHNLFPTIPGDGDTYFPPSWADNLYSFYPRDGSHNVRLDSSIVIEFRGDSYNQEYLPTRIGLERYSFGWSSVRTELSPLSPYEWRLDPGSGELSPDSKYRVWVETRNGWFYSSVFLTRSEDGGYYW